ncbi:hypothetical protein TNCV_402071 [Trichonephila clavipes]|nr:hypothetical protein TNCV_402071 [Trichonephila clavipes]
MTLAHKSATILLMGKVCYVICQSARPGHPGLIPLENKFAFYIVLKQEFSNQSIQNMEGILNFLKPIIDSEKTSFGKICTKILKILFVLAPYVYLEKTLSKFLPALHQPVEQSQELRETCHIDIFGPLKTTPKGKEFPANNLLEFSLDSQDDDQETEQDLQSFSTSHTPKLFIAICACARSPAIAGSAYSCKHLRCNLSMRLAPCIHSFRPEFLGSARIPSRADTRSRIIKQVV